MNPVSQFLLSTMDKDKPLGGRSLIPGVDRFLYETVGGGGARLHESIKMPYQWDKEQRDVYNPAVTKPSISDESYAKFAPQVYPWIDSLQKGGLITPEEAQSYRAAGARSGIPRGADKNPGRMLENAMPNGRAQAIATAFQMGHAQNTEMRARALRNIGNVTQYSLLAGLIFGLGKNWRKLLVERNLEPSGGVEKTATTDLTFARNPSEAKILAYPGDSSLLMPVAAIAAGVGGYELMDWLTDKARKRTLVNKRQAAMQEFQQLFAKGIQTKMAAVLDQAAEAQAVGLDKQAEIPFVKYLPPMGQAGVYTPPIMLALLSFLAAREFGLREADKERKAGEQAIRASQLSRVPKLQFLPSTSAGEMQRQGMFSNRYQIPVLLPPRGQEAALPEEMDLTKLASFLVKRAAEEWKAPTNSPVATNGTGGDAAFKPAAPQQQNAPSALDPRSGGQSGANQGWSLSDLNPVEGVKRFAKNQTMGFAKDYMSDPANQKQLQEMFTDWAKQPQNQELMSGMMDNYVKTKMPGIHGVSQWLNQAQTGSPGNPLQWLAGRIFNNPNTQGWGNFGNLLGMMVPGTHPGMSQLWNQIPGAANNTLGAVGRLMAPLKEGVQGQSAPAA